jgi:uncharacterized Zn-binding protein involved in type VI secretion
MSAQPAARVGDKVAHTMALPGALTGLLVGAAIGVAIVATVATGGLAAVAIGAGAALATTGGLGLAGAYIGESIDGPPTGMITVGSPTIFINGRPAARATLSLAICREGPPQMEATGAETVYFDGMPAGRKDEKLTCSAKIIEGSDNVFIGGPSVQTLAMEPEVPGWLTTTMQAMAIGGTILATGGIAAAYGIGAALGSLALGYGGGILGSMGGRWAAMKMGFGETGQRVAEVLGGLGGGMLGGVKGFRGGQAAERALVNRLGSRYGGTGTKGPFSGRPFNPDKAGGPIERLDYKNTKITAEGVEQVKLHTKRFEDFKPNRMMAERLEKISKGEIEPTDYDRRFYTHELRELQRYRNLGIADDVDPGYDVWNDAHTATLEDFRIMERDASGNSTLYHPDTWGFFD